MQLSFSHHSSKINTITAPGLTPYRVTTPGNSRTTRFLRGDMSFAEMEYHTFRNTTLRMGEKAMKVTDFVQKTGVFRRKYSFTANNNPYRWYPHDSYFALYRNGTRVGKMDFKSKNRTLVIDNDVLPVLDTVIVTLIYVWSKERRSNDDGDDEPPSDDDCHGCCTSDSDGRDCCGCFGCGD